MDMLAQIFEGAGYLLMLAVLILLWVAAARQSDLRRVWFWLAVGWTVNLLGNVAWGVYDMLGGEVNLQFSWLDLIYMSRYLPVWAAFWFFPVRLPDRKWIGLALAMVITAAVTSLLYALAWPDSPAAERFGGVIYPVLDVGMIYTAWQRFRQERGTPHQPVITWLALAMLSYGIANGFNYVTRLWDVYATPFGATLFWTGCDALVLVALLVFLRGKRDPSP